MTNPIEMAMYNMHRVLPLAVLLAIAALFVHAFYALGAFAWQHGDAPGQPGRL